MRLEALLGRTVRGFWATTYSFDLKLFDQYLLRRLAPSPLNAVVLADPSGELTQLQQEARQYPPRLREALISGGLWEAGFCLDIARKAVSRLDSAFISGCLFRAVLLCAHALHAHAGLHLERAGDLV